MAGAWRNYDLWKLMSPDDEDAERVRRRVNSERLRDKAEYDRERDKDERAERNRLDKG